MMSPSYAGGHFATFTSHTAGGICSHHSPGPLICEVLRLRRLPTMATTRALRLDRLFLLPPPTVPSAVSDWLPSVRSCV